jgi:TIR domain-containing protein
MAELKDWLALAPKPPQLAADNRWHVFLSYRSVERSWVLSLYDTLTQLGYRTFMDQFVLDAASGLAGSLERNLEASQAGVLVWSPRNEDSDWCRHEYESFVNMEGAGKSFRYVVARIGKSDLPLFARKKLWLDFSDDREGPRGTGLLKLLYGLEGKPLPDAAVRLAVEIDEETRKSLARIRARANDKDAEGILELAQSDHLAWRVSPLLRCASA